MKIKYIIFALLVGTILAADLSTLLDYVKGGYAIVIGRNAKVDDVLGAIDLGTRLSEYATSQQTIKVGEERVEYEVKGWEARLGLNSNDLSNGAPGFLTTVDYDKDLLPQLKVLVVKNGTQTITDVEEKVGVTFTQLGSSINDNTTLQLVLSNGNNYVEYYVDLSNNPVYANGDEKIFVRLKLAGEDVIISKIGNNKVTLFKGVTPQWVKVGNTVQVENYKVRLDEIIGLGSESSVKLSILDDKGNVVDVAIISPKEPYIGPESGIKVIVFNAYGEPYNLAYLAAGKEVEVNNEKRIDKLFVWRVETNGSEPYYLTKIGYVLKPNETIYLKIGEEIAFPNNYFKLKFLGLTVSDKDYLATLVFKTVNIDATKVKNDLDLDVSSTALEISGVQFVVDNKVVDKVYAVQDNSNNYYLVYYDSKTGKYSTGSISIPLLGATLESSTNVNIKKGLSELFRVEFDTSSGVINYERVSSEYELAIDVESVNNTWLYTNYGHKLFRSSDGKELRIAWTPIQVYARVVLGDVEEKKIGAGEVSVTTVDKAKLKVPVAYFDDEPLPDTTLIVVGGPVVNKVAAAVLGVEYGNYSAAEEYYTKAGAKNKAIIKVGEYNGRTAIVVAGWRAEDTRFACRLLQRFDEFAELANKTAVVVGGTLESPVITELTA
jgi:hypothetical protein